MSLAVKLKKECFDEELTDNVSFVSESGSLKRIKTAVLGIVYTVLSNNKTVVEFGMSSSYQIHSS